MSWLMIATSVLFPNVGGAIGTIFTRKSISTWYNQQLKKPSWRPPNKAFGPVWTYLYSTMGYAAYRVWMELDNPSLLEPANLPYPLKMFFLQILLNWIWTPIFFGYKHLTLAFVEIVILDMAVVMTLLAFWDVDTIAGLLFLPYIAWLTLATLLTLSIWRENPQWRHGPQSSKNS